MSNLQKDTVRHVSEITGHGGRISVTFYFGVFLFCLPLPLPAPLLPLPFPMFFKTGESLKRCTVSSAR